MTEIEQPIDLSLNITVKILYLLPVSNLTYGQVVYTAGGLYSTGDYTSDTFYRQFYNIITGQTVRLLKETYVNVTNITMMSRIVYSNDTNQESPK